MLRRADAWLYGKGLRVFNYLGRYLVRTGKHRPERIFFS